MLAKVVDLSVQTLKRSVLLLCLFLALSPKVDGQTSPSALQVETTVTPLANEDIASECHYSLVLPEANQRVRGVWVIFDRGRDVHELSTDPDVIGFARRFNLALLLHGHCPGKLPSDHGDMNMNPSDGVGPALLRALDQLAHTTSHPELSETYLILLGFSGAGPLSARLIGEYPNRVLAAILSAPGHFRPDGIDTVSLDRRGREVPEFIIAGGADEVSGTKLPYQYFKRYRRRGAPWTFVVQNQSPHCCTANAKALMLDWLAAVLSRRMPRTPKGPLRNVTEEGDWLGIIHTQPTRIKDSFGSETFNVSGAEIRPARSANPLEQPDASWLPTLAIAQEWLSFVKREKHPVLPLR